MRFWDSSAIVPLAVEEDQSDEVRALLDEDNDLAVWWATSLECRSAIARCAREGALTREARRRALSLLDRIFDAAVEVAPSPLLRARAARLIDRHPLRSAHALQLAATEVLFEGLAGRGDVMGGELVCLDERLRRAAEQEGYPVVPAWGG